MQKKKDDISGCKLFVLIIFNADNAPNKYDPPSPKKIWAFGKLKNKNEAKIIIWAAISKIISFSWLFIFIISRIKLIINKWIPKRPLKPSIKFAPFIINKKQSNTKNVWNKLFDNHLSKNIKSTLVNFIDNEKITNDKTPIISISLIFGLTFIFKSSRNPIKNKLKLIIEYSIKTESKKK